MIDSKPKFLQGVFAFQGAGYDKPGPLDRSLLYVVPADKRAQLIYLRAGNSSADMIYLTLMQGEQTMRLFPVAGTGATHVPLAVVEDLEPDTKIEIFLGAPAGSVGTVVIDLGMIEI
jgi:hypothetical protein